MGKTVTDVLNIARAEIGYKEGSNNNNKYGIEYGLNNQPYCVIFIWWIFKHANASSLFYGGNKVALCSSLYKYHQSKGQAITSLSNTSKLQPGAVVFFDFSGSKSATNHVGIVESIKNSTTVVTIEGNTSSTSSGSQSNGEGVYRKERSIKYISRAYMPNYDGSTVTGDSEEVIIIKELQNALNNRGAKLAVDGEIGTQTKAAMNKYMVKKNQRNACVTWVQKRLVALGYDIGSMGVDGVYGYRCANAIKKLQEKKGLEVDGIVGCNTYMALITG